jgi:ankyrin repeat protein
LVAAHADLNAKDNDGETALTAATAFGHANCVKALKEAGAKS